jgi:thioredoxin 2
MPVIVCSKCGIKNRVEKERAQKLQAKCGRCGALLNLTDVVEGTANGKPIIVTDASFEHDVLGARQHPVIVDCWAPWCGPCRMVAPVLDQLAAEADGRYVVAKLNVDENPRIASQYHIQSIPTMLIFKDGALVDRIIGAQPKAAIAARLANAI